MKTLQMKTGRWFAVTRADGTIHYSPVVPGTTRDAYAREIDEVDPPKVTEVMGTGIRLYDIVQIEGEDWQVHGNNAQALSAAAFRLKETA